jgi:thiol-disulfide isomerase/thioredoxin
MCKSHRFAFATRLLASLLLALLPVVEGRAEIPGEVRIGESLREATIQGLNGPSRRLSEFRGKPLIINVWASWCGPCRAEMASLERLAWHDQAGRFTVIGISTDDDRNRAETWLKTSNATISQFIDSGLLMEHMLGATRLPLTVLVGANGVVLEKIYGARQWDTPDTMQLIGKVFRRTGVGVPHPAD